jgi:hypothetical protein|tara:strand:- start:3235 stop:3387 length:153 start_codon:yes stop_codon:yes gene_type:complete
MSFIANVKFMAYIDGKEVTFRKGDKIPPSVAKELNLADKPKLAHLIKPAK